MLSRCCGSAEVQGCRCRVADAEQVQSSAEVQRFRCCADVQVVCHAGVQGVKGVQMCSRWLKHAEMHRCRYESALDMDVLRCSGADTDLERFRG